MTEEIEYDISEFNIHEGRMTHEYFSSDSEDPETVVEEYCVANGYQVERLTYGTVWEKLGDDSVVPDDIRADVNERLEEKFGIGPKDDLLGVGAFAIFKRTGVPDFLIFKEEENDQTDYSFVEAKGEGDPLRQSQVRWFTTHSCLPSAISYVEPASKHNYLNP